VTTIEPIHLIAYEAGADPIEHAAWHIALHMEVSEAVLAGEVNPNVPISRLNHDYLSVARRAIGALLDAGWTPPDVTSLRKGAEQ